MEELFSSVVGLVALVTLVFLWGKRDRNAGKLERRLESLERQLLRQRAEIDALQSGVRNPVMESTSQVLDEPIATPVSEPPIEPKVSDAFPDPDTEPPAEELDGISDPQPELPPVEEELAAMRDYTLPYGKPNRPKRITRPDSVSSVKETNWEKLIGVWGAAAAGALVLVLAAFFFFRHAINAGWLSNELRVVAGVVVGALGIFASEKPLRDRSPVAANFVGAASIVVLYFTFWAAHTMFGFIPQWVAFGLMALTTAASVFLTLRHEAKEIIVVGLAGGFLTPYMLSSGSDHPVVLFTYLAMLNAVLLWVATRTRWTGLAVGALVVSSLYQFGWITSRMGIDRVWMGVLILGVFAAIFSAYVATESEDNPATRTVGVSAAMFPFFALFFMLIGEINAPLLPVVGLMLVLNVGSFVVTSIRPSMSWLGSASVVVSVLVAAGWLLTHSLSQTETWVLCTFVVLNAIVAYVSSIWKDIEANTGQTTGEKLATDSLGVAALAGMGIPFLISVTRSCVAPWPVFFGIAGLFLLAALGRRSVNPEIRVVINAVAALTVVIFHASLNSAGVEAMVSLGLMITLAAVGIASQTKDSFGPWVATAFPLIALIALPNSFDELPEGWLGMFAPATAMTAAMLVGWFFKRESIWAFATVAATFLFHVLRIRLGWSNVPPVLSAHWFTLGLLSLVLIAFVQSLDHDRPEKMGWAWIGSTFAPLLFLYPLYRDFVGAFGEQVVGVLPLALAALPALNAKIQKNNADGAEESESFVWNVVVAALLVAIAVPLQLEREWITVGWALQAAALAFLADRYGYKALANFGAVLGVLVIVRLVLNPYILEYHPPPGQPIVNWIAYTYLIPAAALAYAAGRFRKFDIRFSNVLGVGVIVIVFAWITLTIFDAFSVGREYDFTSRLATRDLVMSLAWALYGVALLALGVKKGILGLRWASLGLLVITTFKVFLYDIGHLSDLYRVFSLVGLAVSLLLISIGYQRYVFTKDAGLEAPAEEG